MELCVTIVNGGIWMIWRTTIQVQVLDTNEQFIHCHVENSSGSIKAYITVVHGKNTGAERTALCY